MNVVVFATYVFLFYVIAGVVIAQFMNRPEKE